MEATYISCLGILSHQTLHTALLGNPGSLLGSSVWKRKGLYWSIIKQEENKVYNKKNGVYSYSFLLNWGIISIYFERILLMNCMHQ